jgi:MraZ protein
VLRGVTQVSLDAKGRFAVPQRYRDALQSGAGATAVISTSATVATGATAGASAPASLADAAAPTTRLVMTADPSRCLLLYPEHAWEPIEQKLMSLSSFNASTRALQRLIVGHADDVEMDAAGRLLIPPSLRQYAALDKRIVLVGQGNKFEIWDEARWDAMTASAMSFSDGGLPAELEGFSL